jgi:hypothetical protein
VLKAKIIDYDGLTNRYSSMSEHVPHASRICGWTASQGRVQGLGGKVFGLDGGTRRTSREPVSEEMLMAWAAEWAKEAKRWIGRSCFHRRKDSRGYLVAGYGELFCPYCHNRRMAKQTRGCAGSVTFVHAARTPYGEAVGSRLSCFIRSLVRSLNKGERKI